MDEAAEDQDGDGEGDEAGDDGDAGKDKADDGGKKKKDKAEEAPPKPSKSLADILSRERELMFI